MANTGTDNYWNYWNYLNSFDALSAKHQVALEALDSDYEAKRRALDVTLSRAQVALQADYRARLVKGR